MTRNMTLAMMVGTIAFALNAGAAVRGRRENRLRRHAEGDSGSTERQKAKKELEDEFNKKKKELEKREADIKKMGEDFEKRSMAMNEDARTKKQGEIQGEMRKYQEMAAKAQMEIQKRERDLTQPIVTKLRSILEDIAKKENFTVILEKSENAVMYAKKDIDLTERIIKEHDKK